MLNPKLYRELNVPFPDVDTAEAALAAFFDEVAEVRKKHKIADVSFIALVTVMEGEDEAQRQTYGHFGDSKNKLQMLAAAYGGAQAEHTSMLSKMAAKSRLSN